MVYELNHSNRRFKYMNLFPGVAKDHPWLQIAHEMRLNVIQEKTFLECLQHISQLPQVSRKKNGWHLKNIQ